ncbi:hypothetical protein ACWF95_42050 [Streptomyces vinaceus]
MCGDVTITVNELTTKGAEFTQPVMNARRGLLARLRLPGGGEVGMYEPRHERATDLSDAAQGTSRLPAQAQARGPSILDGWN